MSDSDSIEAAQVAMGATATPAAPATPTQVETQADDSFDSSASPKGIGKILCSHEGVLLKKASAEFIADLNTSGSLNVVEYEPHSRLYMEWRPNDSILISDDNPGQGDWALVDAISKRTRTSSECKAFNTKLSDSVSSAGSSNNKPRFLQVRLEPSLRIEVRHRGQNIRLLRKDMSVHSEYFFQHGNADIIISTMCKLHMIDYMTSTRSGDEYCILNADSQKLKKTFAELDIGDIKASAAGRESWLSNKLVGFIISIPEYIQPRAAPRYRPGAPDDTPQRSPNDSYQAVPHNASGKSNESYQMISLNNSFNNGQLSGNSLDKSPTEGGLENVKEEIAEILAVLPERKIRSRGAPLNEAQWLEFQTPDGRISDPTRIKEIIFRGGINHNLRGKVWRYILNYYQWHESAAECAARSERKCDEYYKMKLQWQTMSTKQESHFAGYRERKCQIEKDVIRTDRKEDFFAGDDNHNLEMLHSILMTYVMYNFDLGYVQGMSDLLAPILTIIVLDDKSAVQSAKQMEADAFWCFVGFMDIIFFNFDVNLNGITNQLKQLRRLIEYINPRFFNYIKTHESDNMYFCFRWLLVWFKRELSNNDLWRLWECLWTRLPCANFHLLICVALLEQQCDTIIERNLDFNGILKHVNELSGFIDLKHTLELAEAIYMQIRYVENLPNDICDLIGKPKPAAIIDTGSLESPQELDDDDFDHVERAARQQNDRMEEEYELSLLLHHT